MSDTAIGYEIEEHEVDAAVAPALRDVLEQADDLDDPIIRYHALTRAQRLYELAGRRIVRAILAERGQALRETGAKQQDLVAPTGLGTQQRVQQIMATAAERDPIAAERGSGQGAR